MVDFKQRFGEQNAHGEYVFSNVRNGLIVGLVRQLSAVILSVVLQSLTF